MGSRAEEETMCALSLLAMALVGRQPLQHDPEWLLCEELGDLVRR